MSSRIDHDGRPDRPNGRRRFLAATALGLPGGLIAGSEVLAAAGRDGVYGTTDRPAFPVPPAEPDETYWRSIRRLYPLTPDRTYLNTGGLLALAGAGCVHADHDGPRTHFRDWAPDD